MTNEHSHLHRSWQECAQCDRARSPDQHYENSLPAPGCRCCRRNSRHYAAGRQAPLDPVQHMV